MFERKNRQRGVVWWVVLSYAVLLVALGFIAYRLLFPAPAGSAAPTAVQFQAGEQGETFQAAGEMRDWAEGVSAETTPYDYWTMRPRVNPPRMPRVVHTPTPPPPRPLHHPPVDHLRGGRPRVQSEPAFRAHDRPRQPSSCCRRRRTGNAESAASPGSLIPDSVGMQETTLPITSQP